LFTKRLKDSKLNILNLEHWQIINIGIILYDLIVVNLSYFLALWLRFDCKISKIPEVYYSAFSGFTPIYSIICLAVFALCKMYKSIWQYVSITELARTIEASAICFIAHTLLITVLYVRMPMTYYCFGIVLQFIFTLGIRYSYRIFLLLRNRMLESERRSRRVMLIGAGDAGQLLMRDIQKDAKSKDHVVCVIDDNSNKWNRFLEGVLIVGGRDSILDCVEKYNIDRIYFAV